MVRPNDRLFHVRTVSMAVSVGLSRVVEPAGVLPQAAWRLDARPEIAADEARIRVERLNLDAASFRQLAGKHGGDGAAVRAEVLEIVRARGKMHNPVTGSGGMLIGVVEEVGPRCPLPVQPGDRVATLVSLTLTPLAITDGLARWDGSGEQVPAEGHAILFGRSVVAVLPNDASHFTACEARRTRDCLDPLRFAPMGSRYESVVFDAIPHGCRRALDVGCGNGELTRELHRRGIPEVVGPDNDEPCIQRCRNHPEAGGIRRPPHRGRRADRRPCSAPAHQPGP